MPAIKVTTESRPRAAPTQTTQHALRNKPAARARRWCSDRRLRHPLGERVQGFLTRKPALPRAAHFNY